MSGLDEHLKEHDYSSYPDELLLGIKLGWKAAIKWALQSVVRDAWTLDDADDWLEEELNQLKELSPELE